MLTTIDVPRARSTQANSTNERGQSVGAYVDRKGRLHGFLRDINGEFTALDFPGAGATVASRINNQGQIVGAYGEDSDAPDPPQGFLFENGAFTPIDVPGAVRTHPCGINNRGQIVGEYLDAEGCTHGFLLDGGVFTTIDITDPRRGTILFDINDRGRVTGTNDIVIHGYLRDRGDQFTTVDHPDAVEETTIEGTNTRGHIVGRCIDDTGTTRGFLRDRNGFTPIEIPGALGSEAVKINDAGQIVGLYGDTSRTPVPPTNGHLLDRGVVTINVPGAVSVLPFGLNNHGDVVGVFDNGIAGGGFRFSNGKVTTPSAPPGTLATSFPVDIDDRGRILGVYF